VDDRQGKELTQPPLDLLQPACSRVFERRVEVDNLILDPDLVNKRDDLDLSGRLRSKETNDEVKEKDVSR
jgi:hypothetical protein